MLFKNNFNNATPLHSLMTTCFFIKSSTIDVSKYTIKDLVGSTGRLDVVVRCILAALLTENKFEKDVQIWTFLDNYGTYIFDSEQLEYSSFPKNELLLADWFKKLIEGKDLENVENPLSSVKKSEKEIIEAIKDRIKSGYEAYTLSESGQDFFSCIEVIKTKNKLLFVVGNQTGDFIASDILLDLNLPSLSFGAGSYLASSIIRLIKLYLLT